LTFTWTGGDPYPGGISNMGAARDLLFKTYMFGPAYDLSLSVAETGEVGIGAAAGTHLLTVAGEASAEQVLVDGVEVVGTDGKWKGTPGPTGPTGPQGPSKFGASGPDAYLTTGRMALGASTVSTTDRLLVRGDSSSSALGLVQPDNSLWALSVVNEAHGNEGGIRINDSGFLHATNDIAGASAYAKLNSVGAWTQTSDRRLKQDIEPLEGVLERALELEPASYFYIGEDVSTETRSIGFIAQEVEERFPSLVDEDEGYLSLNYAGMNVVALGAVRELSRETEQQLDGFEVELAELEGDLDAGRNAVAERLQARFATHRALLGGTRAPR